MTDERLGTITPCYTVSFQRTLRHSPSRVWEAITSPGEVSAWMGYPAEIEVRVGGRWFVDFSRTNQGELPGVIVRVEPERRLAYAWGLSVVEWQIEPTADGCRYTFIHAGLADRGEDEEGLPAGWQSFLDQMERHLDGGLLAADEERRNWQQLKPLYRSQLDRVLPERAAFRLRTSGTEADALEEHER